MPHIVDEKGVLNEYLADKKRRIPKAHLEKVCKFRQSGGCRYIALTAIGFVCAKNTPLKAVLDEQVEAGNFGPSGAVGDNCNGFGSAEVGRQRPAGA